MDVFVLTDVWFVQTVNGFGAIRNILKKILVAHARDIEGQVNGMWRVFYSGLEMQ